MVLMLFSSWNRCVRCLPLLLSGLFLFSVLCMGPVSAKTDGVNLSGTSAAYTIGDTITFQGETNHAPGTTLLILVEEMAFLPVDEGDEGVFSGTSGTVVIQAGPSSPFWSFSFSTVGWSQGKYQFIVEVPKTGTMQSGTFSLIPVEEMVDAPDLTPPAPSPSDTPHSSPSPVTTPSPNAVPLSPAVCVVGLAAVFLFRSYFS